MEQSSKIESLRATLTEGGNLSEDEIQEFIDLECIDGPKSVNEQVRRYYLKTKAVDPHTAENLLAEISPHITEKPHTLQTIRCLCLALYRHVSGFFILHEKKSYTVVHGNFITI